jgi:hypothetical protein
MCEAIPPLPDTSSWRGTLLSTRTNLAFTPRVPSLLLPYMLLLASYTKIIHASDQT